jgi:hypothetical protein
MHLTFGEMISAVSTFVNAPDEMIDLVRTEINLEYDRIARAHDWEELEVTLGDSMSDALTMTQGAAYLALPPDAAVPLALSDTTNDYVLLPTSTRRHIEDNVASLSTNSRVVHYSSLGYKPVKRPLSTADQIQILAENSADTSKDVRVSGRRNDVEIRDRETITTHSSDPVANATDSVLTYAKGWSIDAISAGEGLNGYLIVREKTTTANVLAHLTEHQRSPRYHIIILENPPDTTSNMAVTYKRHVLPLVDDEDRPVIPVEHEIIETVRGRMRRKDKRYDQALQHDVTAQGVTMSILSERKMQSPKIFQARPEIRQRHFRRGYR